MLDNMTPPVLKRNAAALKTQFPTLIVEASGVNPPRTLHGICNAQHTYAVHASPCSCARLSELRVLQRVAS